MGLLRQPTSDITKGVIWKQLLAFFFPLWFGTFFQQLYNTVDTLVVGRFVGKVALAAVGSTSVIVNLTVGIFTAWRPERWWPSPSTSAPAAGTRCTSASTPPCC